MRLKTIGSAALLLAWGAMQAGGQAVTVRNGDALRQAVAQAKPGTRIRIAPGTYRGGLYFTGVNGTQARPIIIEGADAKQPPLFSGGGNALHFAACSYLTLQDIAVEKMTDNGISIDDGGKYDAPARGIVARRLRIRDIGPRGNHDGIKLSGLDGFRIENCIIERWGGSAIDMVGCHNGVIAGNALRHTDEETSTGVQAKGGCSRIVIRGNRFERAGGRAVNIGGSTGLEFFRPPLKSLAGKPLSEAKDIRVEGNTFVGSGAPVAFVGVDGAVVRFNTLYRPKRWALRILQETTEPGFVPSRNGVFTDNIIAFRADGWGEAVNIGPHTAPQTFTFARNFWYCLDAPARSRPSLPTPERSGIYGADPQFRDAEHGDFRLKPGSPAAKQGADALPK